MLQPVMLLSLDDYQHDSREHEAPRAALSTTSKIILSEAHGIMLNLESESCTGSNEELNTLPDS